MLSAEILIKHKHYLTINNSFFKFQFTAIAVFAYIHQLKYDMRNSLTGTARGFLSGSSGKFKHNNTARAAIASADAMTPS